MLPVERCNRDRRMNDADFESLDHDRENLAYCAVHLDAHIKKYSPILYRTNLGTKQSIS